MASSPEAGSPRHVGLVVDPLAREDGGTEPKLEVDTSAPVESSAADSATPTSDSGRPSAIENEGVEQAPLNLPERRAAAEQSEAPVSGEDAAASSSAEDPVTALSAEDDSAAVHPVRARLLARAALAREVGDGRAEQSPPPSGPGQAISRADELDLINAGVPRPAPISARKAKYPQLSPNMIFVFGTLMGLATVASLVALAMNIDTEHREFDVDPVQKPEATARPETAKARPQAKPKRQRKKLPSPWRISDEKDKPGVRIIEGQIGNSAFLKVVQDRGLEQREAYRAITALKGLKNLDRCDRTDRFAALVDRASSRLLAFEYTVSAEEIYQAKEGADGLLVGKKLDLKVARARMEGAFVVGTDFDRSAEGAGFERGFANIFDKALDGHTSIAELEPRTIVRAIAQEVTVLGEFSRYAGLEAVEVRSADPKAEPLRIYYFNGQKTRGYFDARGRAPYDGGWARPIKDAPITSRFNPKRLHPVLKKVMPHNGTDFGAASGTPVGASSFGTVKHVGYSGASGNLVLVEHASDVETGYAHLSRFAEGLKVGDKVKRTEVVGYVGSTGRSTGPHLHFSVKKKGEFVDPETLNFDAMRVLPPEERSLFAEVRARYDKLLEAIELPPLPAAPEPPLAKADPAADPGLEDHPVETFDDPLATAPATAKPAAPQALAAAPQPAAPKPASATGKPNAVIYMTDEELLKLQPLRDSDEVR